VNWQIGDKIENRYEIHDIKQGGFGIVYICYDHTDELPLALKTFQARFLSSQKEIDDFTQEAITWTKLDKHKNIVKAYYVKNIEGQPYIFLEYVAGGNLDEWLYTRQLDLPLALNFALQFCTGMDYSYQKMGLIHRDIKPGNILLTSDKTVKITDFGLAKTLELEAQPEQTMVPPDISYVQSTTAGTLPYMAPEQFKGKKIDIRSDIYGFGIVLYQMVAGTYPLPKKSSWEKMHLIQSPLPIKQSIPAELDALIHKCLEKDAAKRYRNFSDLRQDLSKIYFDLTGETIPEESGKVLEVWELNNKGGALGNLGRYDEAIDCYDEALDINPRYADAWNNKGAALGNLGRYDEELACYDEVLDVNPRFAGAWYNKGIALGNLGHTDEALTCYDKALDINPRCAEAWNNKGNVLDNLGRAEEAIDCYDKALDINPRYAEAWNNKGNALDNLGRAEEAIDCYDKVLNINPRFAEAWNNKGTELVNLGHAEEAFACYDKALDINPRHAETWYSKGVALYNLGRSEEALDCYDKALDINPRYAETWKNKGVALANLGLSDEALACFDGALDINPRDAEVWNNKGITLLNLGRAEEAILAFQKFIEFAPPQHASHVEKVEEVIQQLKGMV